MATATKYEFGYRYWARFEAVEISEKYKMVVTTVEKSSWQIYGYIKISESVLGCLKETKFNLKSFRFTFKILLHKHQV